ncbi:hypothetical protein HHK36_031325 [Tetracentron sinense]|uniref:Uncharacterized protein n=1 Tax=Tetracentron sinense TaxID=13715 RepID=A0A835D1L7_TETSI|nr:hypothetical protein HHK36_031325 [Tetracentron sinense]
MTLAGVRLIASSSTLTGLLPPKPTTAPLLPPKQDQHQHQHQHRHPPLLRTKTTRRNAVSLSLLSLVPHLSLPPPATAFSLGISGPKDWLREQKKKASRFLLAPIDASRESLHAAYLVLTASASDYPEKDLGEIQRLLRSAARDCVPQERDSFVSFQASTGVEDLFVVQNHTMRRVPYHIVRGSSPEENKKPLRKWGSVKRWNLAGIPAVIRRKGEIAGDGEEDCWPGDAGADDKVCTYRLIVKNASSLLDDKSPIKLEAEAMLSDLIRSFTSLNGVANDIDQLASNRQKVADALMDTISSLNKFEQGIKDCLEI